MPLEKKDSSQEKVVSRNKKDKIKKKKTKLFNFLNLIRKINRSL